MSGSWEAVIGLEIHVQLRTRQKLFAGDGTAFGAEPNSQVSPVTLGLPGALPVLNQEAVELAVKTAVALGCTVHPVSIFARKNYFYPDLPKGYQISQFDRPLATDGELGVEVDDQLFTVRIHRIHMEEDAGKSVHDRFPDATAVDLNRAGVPLVEIVTEPDLRGADVARAWLGELKRLLEYVEVSDCNMEEGSLRVDANVSIRPAGASELGTKTEVKNLNSFSGVERAIELEVARQIALVESGGVVRQETLLYDANRGELRSMRSKEESHDYRYFPDPDLPPLHVDPDHVEEIRAALPELPQARVRRFKEAYGIPGYDAGVLTADRIVADWFEALAGVVVQTGGGDPKTASNWVMGPVLALLKERGVSIAALGIPPDRMAELIGMVSDGTISPAVGRKVLQMMALSHERPRAIVEMEGLAQVRDEGLVEGWIRQVMEDHPGEVERYREGETRLRGFFMGEVMKASDGKADPKEVGRLLGERLAPTGAEGRGDPDPSAQ
jgi:aspartyl-tRNA(Asn)/glutamyl-tRNA(Gln) amidotransferase subunit B